MQQAVEKLVGRWGRIDIVFANAGINGVWAPLEDLKPEEWDRTLDIKRKCGLMGPNRCCRDNGWAEQQLIPRTFEVQ